MANELLYVGFCRICGTGPLGLRKCGGCGQVVILCDECDAAWISADLHRPPAFTSDAALPCPACNSSLMSPQSRWANEDEVHATGWLHEALVSKALKLERGESFEPHGHEVDNDPPDQGFLVD